jgi:prepilin signal peptidase PulO-like enzyme (type II secretory pathway)
MVKNVNVKELTEGDWLFKDIKVGRKVIASNWRGLNKEEISQLRKKYRKVKIRRGIPFVPVFLISFLILIYVYFYLFDKLAVFLF